MPSTSLKKTCIVIVGPTAVGKTAVSLELAQHFKTAIISADSRQCYRELDIGVAKPSAEQLQEVRHYFISSHSVEQDINAGMFEQYALDAAAEIFQFNDIAIMVGGTGLYIRAFCEGMDAIPVTDNTIRETIIRQYQAEGLTWLQQEILAKDPAWYASGEIQNPQRMMRALEVILSTGESILSFRTSKKNNRDFNIIKVGLALPREQLYRKINIRVDEMIDAGLEAEARSVIGWRDRNALQTVGYRELFDYMDGHITLDKAIELIKRNTRHYAKRQLTWFSKDPEIKWFSPVDCNQLINSFDNLV